MPDVNVPQRAELVEALNRTKDQGVGAQAAAVEAIMPAPTQRTADHLWIYLVVGLLILIGMGIVGLIVLLIKGKSAATLLTVVTALITGLFGLFVKSPAST
jgi:CHASE2 domain-containing sensor protein